MTRHPEQSILDRLMCLTDPLLEQLLWEARENPEGGMTIDGVDFNHQSPNTSSCWAQWVKQGFLKSHYLVWAVVRADRNPYGNKPVWLGCLLGSDTKGPKFYDLRHEKDSARLRDAKEAMFEAVRQFREKWTEKVGETL